MAYDKAVLFSCFKTQKSKEKNIYRINNCDWGWFVSEDELEEYKNLGELEYSKTLSPLECIKRYEINKNSIDEYKEKRLSYFKNNYIQTKSLPYFHMYQLAKSDFNLFERCIYDKRLINVTFEKYWWESGLN
ncbi:hypothetical protein [Candidatus Pelagibacter sp. HIMB109]|uniref:hypothetical protein n=1 Tax=Candidatus Pelagibacter sp. HIMB109 TaxID=3415412 RepID=UPI003F828E49